MGDFDWDQHNLAHIARHHIVPFQAEQAISIAPVRVGQIWRNREPRVIEVGPTRDGLMVTVVWTPRNGKKRVVTARQSSREERNLYVEQKKKH